MGLFDKIKQGLSKTRSSVIKQVEGMLSVFTKIDDDLFEQLEEILILADLGVSTATEICEELRKEIKLKRITNPQEIKGILKDIIASMLEGDNSLNLTETPSVILVIGVNGAGKTTTIGKLASRLKGEGKSVMLAAADTFRAAAIEQLEIWSECAGVPIIKQKQGSDPAAVIFDAVEAAKARKIDVLICDTAGRLHNKKNLMDELSKIVRVIEKSTGQKATETLLVLDATTGQNAVNQAREFKQVTDLTGIILTKIDGTAKGGIIISIKNELNIPVKFIGVGEQVDDLQKFDSRAFVEALFDE